ncbi:class C beta-lactamase-related serine hydrolase [Halioglobus maricola]|uniref:Class C beta-lactamase-related serine hydrolase n=1 Tax=Halioglobus maricola TaxID=2601894 RepID=A0A5P9NHY2_9GAMM|nr:serine hydrolase [Halioglobus maricola]QFU75402.1 class C beta-lactamase-related serine hydrolase [Halioglobus maricola]
MKAIKIVLAIVIVSVAAIGIYYAPIIERLYFAMNMDDEASMAENLRISDTYYKTHLIQRSSKPEAFPRNVQQGVIPETFVNHGETLSTAEFLKEAKPTGLLIIKDGQVIHEQYWQGLVESDRQFAFSVAKSMTSVLVGMAIGDGLIDDVNDPVVKYLPHFKGTAWDKATIANVLEMSSGVDFDEDYSRTDTDMQRFQVNFVLDKPMEPFLLALKSAHPPGTKQGYNSMETQLAGFLLRAVLGDRTLADYMHEKLWEPLGAQDDATWTTDVTGMEVAIGGLSMSLRDLAKVGQLFLQRGQWHGEQLIPESWVLESTTPSKPYQMPGRDNPLSEKPFGYGYLWWTPVEPNGREYYASGLYGQYLFVNEDKGLVIAMYNANNKFNEAPDWWKERYQDLFQAIAIGL